MLNPRLVQIEADLECEWNGNILRIRSDRERKLVCELPNAKTLFALRRVGGKSTSLRKIGRGLSLIDQTVDVLVAGKLVARFGRDANSRLMCLIGAPSTELRLWKIAAMAMNG